MDDLHATPPRAGAQAAPLLSPAEAGPDGQLPMVVWLRGDEPLCEEFTLDADAVMERLGIRRSRLTQISGRELRVGRTRKGRYVTPVYRPADVEAYREWTRPTASHQKSSSVLQHAADALLGQKDELALQMESGFDSLLAAVEAAVRRGNAEAARAAADQEARLRGVVAGAEDALRATLQLHQKGVTALHAKVDAAVAQLDRLAAAQAVLAKELTEVAALARLAREDAQVRHAELVALARAGREDAEAVKAAMTGRTAPRKKRVPRSAKPAAQAPKPTQPQKARRAAQRAARR